MFIFSYLIALSIFAVRSVRSWRVLVDFAGLWSNLKFILLDVSMIFNYNIVKFIKFKI